VAPVDPKRVLPRLRLIAVTWGVAALFVAAGVFLSITGFLDSVEGVAPTRTFASGETVTVTLDPADGPAIYLASGTSVNYECSIGGGSGQARLLTVEGRQRLTMNGTQWEQILRVNAPSAGAYQVTCTTQQQAGARFGVGRDITAAVGDVLGGAALLALIPGVGVLAAIIVTIVVLVRRSSHRKRLAAGG